MVAETRAVLVVNIFDFQLSSFILQLYIDSCLFIKSFASHLFLTLCTFVFLFL